jgi:biopolymer transport protein TolR
MQSAMRVRTFPRPRRSPKLFSDFHTLPFASVMAMVVFVVLLVLLTETSPHNGGSSVDLPKVLGPVAMPGAVEENAMKVSILRDGKVYFGADLINPLDLGGKIKDRLKDPEVERKVYIVADFRARWGTIKKVLEGIHDAGVLRVAFLTDKRKFSAAR